MCEQTSLSKTKPGEKAIIKTLNVEGNMRRRLLDIGLVKNTKIECLGKSPGGDPAAYFIRGAVIAIRKADSEKIIVHIV